MSQVILWYRYPVKAYNDRGVDLRKWVREKPGE